MSGNKFKRKKLFVDARVQGAFALRVVAYWAMCLFTVALMLLCWRILTGPARLFYTHFDDMWFFYGPAAVASLILLPLIVVDSIRFSNRFAGPMFRLHRSMQQLARGEHVDPVRFRDGDFWQEFARDFNAVVARIQGQSRELPEPQVEEEPVGAGAAE